MPRHLHPLSAHAVQLHDRGAADRTGQAPSRDAARDSSHRQRGPASRVETLGQGSDPAQVLPATEQAALPRRRCERLRCETSVTAEPRTRWGTRSAELYTDAYANMYRAQDESVGRRQAVARLSEWLRALSDRFPDPIDALDLGCGTGRYFHALAGARRLVGIDVSRPMLDRAKRPSGPDNLTLIEGDFLTHEFDPAEFDL